MDVGASLAVAFFKMNTFLVAKAAAGSICISSFVLLEQPLQAPTVKICCEPQHKVELHQASHVSPSSLH